MSEHFGGSVERQNISRREDEDSQGMKNGTKDQTFSGAQAYLHGESSYFSYISSNHKANGPTIILQQLTILYIYNCRALILGR
jgi:hypothetical protein